MDQLTADSTLIKQNRDSDLLTAQKHWAQATRLLRHVDKAGLDIQRGNRTMIRCFARNKETGHNSNDLVILPLKLPMKLFPVELQRSKA